MPYLNVRLTALKSTETATKVTHLLTDLATQVLGKAQDVVAVDIQFADAALWSVGDQPVANQAPTFFIEINVTTGTNTRDEKAQFIKQAFAGMQAILGPVAPASYVIVRNVAADDWGFGGKTQAYRYIAPQLSTD